MKIRAMAFQTAFPRPRGGGGGAEIIGGGPSGGGGKAGGTGTGS